MQDQGEGRAEGRVGSEGVREGESQRKRAQTVINVFYFEDVRALSKFAINACTGGEESVEAAYYVGCGGESSSRVSLTEVESCKDRGSSK